MAMFVSFLRMGSVTGATGDMFLACLGYLSNIDTVLLTTKGGSIILHIGRYLLECLPISWHV